MVLQKHNSKLQNINFFLGDQRIDITSEYTYLGLKLTQNTTFNVATQQLSEKAMHALFKIRKQLDFHHLCPKLAMKIFDIALYKCIFNNNNNNIIKFVQETNINDFAKTLQQSYISHWRQEIEKSSKLSFYATFKKDYLLEDYLEVIKDPKQRRIHSKFRISNHKLEIECGRYHSVNRDERFCTNCNNNTVEDEFHVAFRSKTYEGLRTDSHNILKDYFQTNITDELHRKLLSNVMSSKDPVHVL